MKLKAKHVVFLLIGLATLYVLNHNERFVIEPEHPVWQRYEAFKWVLLPHAIFGSITLLSAPFQFSDRLRQRFPKAHRITGRLYVLGVLVLAPTGAYIQYFQERLFSAARESNGSGDLFVRHRARRRTRFFLRWVAGPILRLARRLLCARFSGNGDRRAGLSVARTAARQN